MAHSNRSEDIPKKLQAMVVISPLALIQEIHRSQARNYRGCQALPAARLL